MSMAESERAESPVEVECEKCGYEWTYTGEMWNTTCPRCNRKTPTGLAPDDE